MDVAIFSKEGCVEVTDKSGLPIAGFLRNIYKYSLYGFFSYSLYRVYERITRCFPRDFAANRIASKYKTIFPIPPYRNRSFEKVVLLYAPQSIEDYKMFETFADAAIKHFVCLSMIKNFKNFYTVKTSNIYK